MNKLSPQKFSSIPCDIQLLHWSWKVLETVRQNNKKEKKEYYLVTYLAKLELKTQIKGRQQFIRKLTSSGK